MRDWMRRLRHLLLVALFGPTEQIKLGFTFHLEAIDPDGTRHGTRVPVAAPEPSDWGLFRRGLMALVMSVVLVAACYVPESLLVAPLFGRVTTVGLNALLSSTLANSVTSTTWYVGLCKYVSSTGVTNGTTTFTDTNGTFVAGDVGRNILLRGQGVAGADLLTTVSAVGSNTSITLGTAATATSNTVQYAFECRLADTMGSHTSFVESTAYSGNRVAWTPGAVSAGSVSNSGSPAAFSITGTDFVFGAFLTSNNTQGGSTGTLYGMGVNSAGVALAVTNGSTVNVTITCTATAT